MNVIGYGRVSTSQQKADGHSLDQQRRAIERMALSKGWVVNWIEDVCTGTTADRPGLKKAMDLLESGEACAVCVTKLDRLFRSTIEFGLFMKRCKANAWQFVSLDLNIDTTTPFGEFLLTIFAALAEFEVEMIRARTKEGLAEARAKGVVLGQLQGKRLSNKILAEIRADRADGISLGQIARWLTRKKIRTPSGKTRWCEKQVLRQLDETPRQRKAVIRTYKAQRPLRDERKSRAKTRKEA